MVGEQPAIKCIQTREEKLHHLKSQPIFSEVSQIEWRKPFDFPSGISCFPMYMVQSTQG